MGYGPSSQNRFGWCWRNEHGGGRRMTPYFETEELVDKFHDYIMDNKSNLSDTMPKETRSALNMLNMINSIGVSGEQNNMMAYMNRFDLRTTKLSEINELAEEFSEHEDVPIDKIVIKPVAETMREFYGLDQEDMVGYRDPTPFSWEEDEEEDDDDEEDD
jgi:hypothetical protein